MDLVENIVQVESVSSHNHQEQENLIKTIKSNQNNKSTKQINKELPDNKSDP